MGISYFLDTYAMMEIIKGNPAYQKYLHEQTFTTIFNLYELFFSVLKDYDEDLAESMFFDFKDYEFDVKPEHIFAGACFKLRHRKRNISYVDALGYCIAEQEGMTFLTGDKEFRRMKNVEFVK
ncbi:PIN domain-containing protein [Candidatus Woesearchaeota archaeon]|nr:PIN domain-containing protein [Candidatus Woesearchaeota archaeon]